MCDSSIPAKYVFLDIVDFTAGRSVENQVAAITALNRITRAAIETHSVASESCICIPLGDGLCIALLNVHKPLDIHLAIALTILAELDSYNASVSSAQLKFKVRIGINENIDNIVTDINGNKNIAGSGINYAQRIMSFADGNQILVGQAVHDILRFRERYMNSFRSYTTTAKHGVPLQLFQYCDASSMGLNRDEPNNLRTKTYAMPRLSEKVANYLAHAWRNEESIIKLNREVTICGYACPVLLWALAIDSMSSSNNKYEKHRPYVKFPEESFEKQFTYYSDLDFFVLCEWTILLSERHLGTYSDCFVLESVCPWHLISPTGKTKLLKDWPDIAKRFDLAA